MNNLACSCAKQQSRRREQLGRGSCSLARRSSLLQVAPATRSTHMCLLQPFAWFRPQTREDATRRPCNITVLCIALLDYSEYWLQRFLPTCMCSTLQYCTDLNNGMAAIRATTKRYELHSHTDSKAIPSFNFHASLQSDRADFGLAMRELRNFADGAHSEVCNLKLERFLHITSRPREQATARPKHKKRIALSRPAKTRGSGDPSKQQGSAWGCCVGQCESQCDVYK